MRITREQYEKAKNILPKLEKAKETVRQWDEAVASFGRTIDGLELTEIEIGGLFPSFRGRRKEVQGATESATSRGAA